MKWYFSPPLHVQIIFKNCKKCQTKMKSLFSSIMIALNTLDVFGYMILFRWDSNTITKFKFNHCGVHLHNQHIHNLKFIKSKYQDFFFETDCGFYFSFLDKDFSFIENRTFRLWRFSSCWAKWAYMVRSAFNKKLNEHLHKKSNLKKVYLPGFLERMENRSGHQILASNIAFYTRTSNNTVIRSGLK